MPDVPNAPTGVLPAFVRTWPHIAVYMLSYLVIGYAWIWHHLTFAVIVRATRALLRINLILLLAVAFYRFRPRSSRAIRTLEGPSSSTESICSGSV